MEFRHYLCTRVENEQLSCKIKNGALQIAWQTPSSHLPPVYFKIIGHF